MLKKGIELDTNYFQAKSNYFWLWDDKADFIQLNNNLTICYREELINILENLAENGFPSLSCLLLVILACQDKWKKKENYISVFEKIIDSLSNEEFTFNKRFLKHQLNQTIKLLDMVNDLPVKLRSDSAKIYLITEIFSGNNLKISGNKTKFLITQLSSNKFDSIILKIESKITLEEFESDLSQIQKVLEKFSNSKELENFLKAGVKKIPKKIDLEVDKINKSDLIEILKENKKTFGISQLSQRLIALINIPLHSKGVSYNSIGGFSDITNHGNFDKLLPSELAQEDIILTARLINNEALYFRREETPANSTRSRLVFVDTTIKMWGTNKLFAISSAIACLDDKLLVNTYFLNSKNSEKIDLSNVDNVIDSLQKIDIGLNCYKTLESLFKNDLILSNDSIFITSSETFKDPEFISLVSKININYLITVNQNGQVYFYQLNNGITKLLSSSLIDLKKLLFSETNNNLDASYLPAFLVDPITPLYLPTNINIFTENSFDLKTEGFIGITDQQNVLYWSSKDKGAIELIEYIDSGKYYFGFNEKNIVYILVYINNLVKIYKISLNKFGLKEIDLSNEINNFIEAAYHENYFYIKTITDVILINCNDLKIWEKRIYNSDTNIFNDYKELIKRQNTYQLKDSIYRGYNLLKKAKNVFINSYSELSFDEHSIVLKDEIITIVKKNDNQESDNYAQNTPQIVKLSANPKIRFYKSSFNNGNLAIIDNRGLLHLKSKDKNIPEVTILLTIANGQKDVIACWSSNNFVCGNPYFYDENKYKVISELEFYKNYIQLFLI